MGLYNLFIRRNSVKGVYMLIIEIIKPIKVMISRRKYSLGKTHLIYVGSAYGPGGLSARILRHLRKDKKIHWHIDQITSLDHARIKAICLLPSAPSIYESIISGFLTDVLDYIPRFGSTDKPRDKSHLFICRTMGECIEAIKTVQSRMNYPVITIFIDQ